MGEGGAAVRFRKAGGEGGVLSALGPIRKARGGGGGGGGGGGCTLQAQYERRGGLAEEGGGVPYMKGQLYDLLNSARFTIDY